MRILHRMSIGTDDFDHATAFYDEMPATLSCKRVMQHPDAVAYRRMLPELWARVPLDKNPASTGNGSHVGFFASSAGEVDELHRVALRAGETDDRAPGPRPAYGEPYHGCFIVNPDGHKIEAVVWNEHFPGAEE